MVDYVDLWRELRQRCEWAQGTSFADWVVLVDNWFETRLMALHVHDIYRGIIAGDRQPCIAIPMTVRAAAIAAVMLSIQAQTHMQVNRRHRVLYCPGHSMADAEGGLWTNRLKWNTATLIIRENGCVSYVYDDDTAWYIRKITR